MFAIALIGFALTVASVGVQIYQAQDAKEQSAKLQAESKAQAGRNARMALYQARRQAKETAQKMGSAVMIEMARADFAQTEATRLKEVQGFKEARHQRSLGIPLKA